MKNEDSKAGPKYRNSKKLVNTINSYGRRRLSQETKISLVMINQVCIHWRSFGVGNAYRVAKILGLSFLDCIDQRGLRSHKELVQLDQVEE